MGTYPRLAGNDLHRMQRGMPFGEAMSAQLSGHGGGGGGLEGTREDQQTRLNYLLSWDKTKVVYVETG